MAVFVRVDVKIMEKDGSEEDGSQAPYDLGTKFTTLTL